MDFNPNFKQFKEVNVYRLVLVISCQRWISKVLTDLNFLHLVPNFIFLQSIILFACCLIIVLFTKKIPWSLLFLFFVVLQVAQFK